MIIEVKNIDEMLGFGAKVGGLLNGGEIIELVGDVGAGKTTFVKGIAKAMGIDETVQSPSFTINRVYDAKNNIRLSHYDFYRLADAGIMAVELGEVLADPNTVKVIEWSNAVKDILPKDRLIINIDVTSNEARRLLISADGEASLKLMEKIR
ncbi:tRNA (adenosine(37)-N6)-threonylcarbamoyltransferase complex ATPase subunit type 1 TsaE [Candidatus Saccharibacteria bacterium]|nr:tRNA (adenosine(37)-N6)-threonylcarbamoyltransferase complex ATPase subunit type 1 TsaE [Candidatus Saccharibacteria bacterium]